ncbi:MAG TPA: ABC transporter permease, partial [bacterium]
MIVVSRAMALVSLLGAGGLDRLQRLGRAGIFFWRALARVFVPPLAPAKLLVQVSTIGARSLLVICLTGAFTGMVLGLQGYYTLVKFGSEGLLGAAVSLSLIREMGPVLTAIMVTARAGSAMAAEIGIMRIGEEIDALKTMDIDPIRYLVSPRIAAAAVSFPLLTAIFDVVGIVGGYLTGSLLLGLSSGTYFWRVEESVEMKDVTGGFIKAV